MRIKCAKWFDGIDFQTNHVLVLEAGKVSAIEPADADFDHEAEGLVVPGFVDLQVNGGGGVLFNADPTVEGIETMMMAHAKYGTTAMLPTIITDSADVMQQAADSIAEAIERKSPGIIGVHFEGPHLSVAKKGAHSEAFIRSISDAEWNVFSRQDLGHVLVTLAPENVSPEDITRLTELGVRICLGHTNADYSTAQAGIDAGADGFTHLFNAMSPLQGREPGVVGAAFLNPSTSAGLIVDGHHVDYQACRLAIQSKGEQGIFLVTDAMPPVGTDDDVFAFFDREVHLTDGALHSTTGELAGSVLDMATAVRNTYREVGCSLESALRMASLSPADFLYRHKIKPHGFGRLAQGSRADFVVLDDDLNVLQTWIGGQRMYTA